jgi:membrane-bound lytic murein transglycosylase D
MDEKSLNIEYNIGLENVIKSFLKNRKKGFERLMEVLHQYLKKNWLRKTFLEIKYLAVVESALNRAVSRVGQLDCGNLLSNRETIRT